MKALQYNISFPSKTFLIGEYAVLNGAPAILVNTEPRFQFFVKEKPRDKKQVSPKEKALFHPQSPAGQWLKQNPKISQFYHIEYQDPYLGRGGFGFSSAQFLLLYLLSGKEKKPLLKNRLFKLWTAYRELKFEGEKPSGADLVSQCLGGVCVFSFAPFSARTITWPFPDLDFFLIRTNTKLNTHTHLETLSEKHFPGLSFLPGLSLLAEKAKSCINKCDKKGFISTLKAYSVYLEKQGLVHQDTLLFLNRIRKLKQVIVAKGCGAMGAEVIAVFFDSKDKKTLKDLLKKEHIVASLSNITGGVKIQESEFFL